MPSVCVCVCTRQRRRRSVNGALRVNAADGAHRTLRTDSSPPGSGGPAETGRQMDGETGRQF